MNNQIFVWTRIAKLYFIKIMEYYSNVDLNKTIGEEDKKITSFDFQLSELKGRKPSFA